MTCRLCLDERHTSNRDVEFELKLSALARICPFSLGMKFVLDIVKISK